MFLRTVAAIGEAVIDSQPQAFGLYAEPCESVCPFVLASLDSMPRLLSFGLKTFTMLFAVSALLYGGRPFPWNGKTARARQWRRWRSHRWSYMRDFARFYEVLVTLAVYSAGERAAACEPGAVAPANSQCV